MPDESYVVHEQARAAAQWEASCASDDALKRLIRAQLSEGRLGSVNGVSKSRRGTGRPCIVCRRTIGPTEIEREVEGQGVFLHAHEACYKPWREESVARRAADRPAPQSAYVAGRTLKWPKGEAGTLSAG
jgi:hypothetical protein